MVAMWLSHRLATRPRAMRAVARAAFVLLATKALLAAVPRIELQIFPWTWYIYVSYWHFPCAVVVCVFLWRRAGTPFARVRTVVLSIALLGVILWHGRFFLIPPRAEELKTSWDADGVCVQSRDWSCVPAAVATLLRHHGIKTTESEVAQLALSRPHYGTHILGTHRALRILGKDKGLRVRLLHCSVETLRRLRKPCMILSHFNVDHVNVVYAATRDFAVVAEPSWGMEGWPNIEDIGEVWSGEVIAVYRDDMFEPPALVWRDDWRSPFISADLRKQMAADVPNAHH